MTPESVFRTNFAFFEEHDQLLVRLGMLAEKYFSNDPNTSILKLRQLGEALAQHIASRVGLLRSTEESQFDLVRRLRDEGILPREVAQLFDEIRRAGNAASHALGAITEQRLVA
jgi:type I restriction enzyme R subunit